MKVVAGLVVLAIVAVVGFALYGQHQRALAAAEAARVQECRDLYRTAEAERLPDGSLPIDNRALNIRVGACEMEGR